MDGWMEGKHAKYVSMCYYSTQVIQLKKNFVFIFPCLNQYI